MGAEYTLDRIAYKLISFYDLIEVKEQFRQVLTLEHGKIVRLGSLSR